MDKRSERIAFQVTGEEKRSLRRLSILRGEATSVVLRDLIREAISKIEIEDHANSEEPNDTNLE